MIDYIKREAAIARVKKQMDREPTFGPWAENDKIAKVCYGIVIEALERLPSTDVEPIVRCKDCKHRDPEDKRCDSGGLERAGNIFPVSDDYFCAYGEKRS